MHPSPESWLSKLRWRLDQGLTGPALRAMGELAPATDPEVIRALIGALSYHEQDVRERAAWILGHSGWAHAHGPPWGEAAGALGAAATRAVDDEERANMERAATSIEARQKDPPPGEGESLVTRLEWYIRQGIEVDAVRCMTELGPTADPAAISLLTDLVRPFHSPAPRLQNQAVRCLTVCGALHARSEPLWQNVLQALRDMPDSSCETAADRESRLKAIETIEGRLEAR